MVCLIWLFKYFDRTSIFRKSSVYFFLSPPLFFICLLRTKFCWNSSQLQDNLVNILVSKKDATKSDAITIFKIAYEKLGNNYTPSVSFKA